MKIHKQLQSTALLFRISSYSWTNTLQKLEGGIGSEFDYSVYYSSVRGN